MSKGRNEGKKGGGKEGRGKKEKMKEKEKEGQNIWNRKYIDT